MLSEEGGRYRAPVSKYAEMLAAVTGLFFFSTDIQPCLLGDRPAS